MFPKTPAIPNIFTSSAQGMLMGVVRTKNRCSGSGLSSAMGEVRSQWYKAVESEYGQREVRSSRHHELVSSSTGRSHHSPPYAARDCPTIRDCSFVRMNTFSCLCCIREVPSSDAFAHLDQQSTAREVLIPRALENPSEQRH